MHATEAFLNAVVEADLNMLNTLLRSSERSFGGRQSEDERPAEEERDTGAKPGAFRNDPEDPANPNEARDRHLKKVNKIEES